MKLRHQRIVPFLFLFAFGFFLLPNVASAFAPQDVAGPPEEPKIAPASKEGEEAIGRFKVPAGFQTRLIAAEPLVANPCAFVIDSKGRIYVCETFRQERGIEDNRGHQYWVKDDLAAQTVADRVAYIKKHHARRLAHYTSHDDRIRLLWDSDGDGVMDRDEIFAKHFNQIEDGTGAGVLPVGDHVLYTCIPKLWLLRDADGDNVAEERKALIDGFGVRFALRGHDLHGLILGPDGRVYFSIGDRGYNVVSQEGKRFANPESGAVFRCEIDGSGLEVVATGLRNPQELAFDDYGNLFTGDNNSDSGDRARWVYVVEGGETGWRMAYQYLPDRGPFNREKIWHPYHPGQPAFIIPPIANFADGPSGLAYYPGTGLPDHFKGRFFLCDFRGTPHNSGVKTLRNEPDGAFFKLVDAEDSFWSILATDIDFGVDGGLYVSDWVQGWSGEGKGRIYRFSDPAVDSSDIVREVASLLREGMTKQPVASLEKLLAHADRRVRQQAQLELVRRGEVDALLASIAPQKPQFGRLHAIWGLSHLLRTGNPPAATAERIASQLVALLDDEDAEVRCQAAWVIGDRQIAAGEEKLLARLASEEPRPQHFFAAALGKLQSKAAVAPMLNLLAANDNRDPIIRHGAIMGLVGAGADAVHVAASKHLSSAARLGAVVALRKLESPLLTAYLNDADALVKVEAARAIHDVPITEGLAALAAVELHPQDDNALVRRVLNARFRLGTPEAAASLVAYAARADHPADMRVEALKMLAEWAKPDSRDRVHGMWRPIEPRSDAPAREALLAQLGNLVAAPEAIRNQTVKTAVALGIKEIAPALLTIVQNDGESPENRGAALTALAELGAPETMSLVEKALESPAASLRVAALGVLVRRTPEAALDRAVAATKSSEKLERQSAYAFLASLKSPEADAAIAASLEKVGSAPADVRLDILEAARARNESPVVRGPLQAWEASLAPDDPVARNQFALKGGDAERGRSLFFGKPEISCVRCHKIGGVGGEVGPDLSQIAKEKDRLYLLEAIVAPSKSIAKNFESVVIHDSDGRIHTGVLKAKTDETTTLLTAEGKLVEIKNADIEEQSQGKSAMPEDLPTKMTAMELRDLVEYLSSLK